MSLCERKRDSDGRRNRKASYAILASDRLRSWFKCLLREKISFECAVHPDKMERLLLSLLLRSSHV